MSSSSPITSVPDPSDSSALASIITQVQPGQAAPVVRRPAAPSKSNAQTDASRKKKKKKKSAVADAARDEAAQLRSQDQAVAEAARLGSEAAQSQARANTKTTAAGTAAEAPTQETDSAAPQHSHQASSTLVGTSTAGDTLGRSAVLGVSDSPVVGSDQPAERVAQTAPIDSEKSNPTATESSEGTVDKDGLIDVPPREHAGEAVAKPAAAAAPRPAAAAAKPSPARPVAASGPSKAGKKPGLGARLVALLTCSSATSAEVRHEMQEKQRAPASVAARNVKPPTAAAVAPRTPTKPTPAGGEYETTPGGGTKLPRDETGNVMSGAVVPPGAAFVTADEARKSRSSLADSEDSVSDDDDEMDMDDMDYLTDDQTEEQRLILQGGIGIPVDEHGNPQPLLTEIGPQDHGRKCLVLDLDETLVHSSFKMIQNADFIVPVEIDGTVHNVYVIKRPGVDEFMRQMGEIYEVVVFTASLSKYADPVLDMLDIHHAVRHRLFRESCYNHKGNYVKDLSQLGRPIADTIIIDNSPASYIFHPNNAVPVSSWFNDPHDTELTDLCPFLADLANVDDVRAVLDGSL